MEKTWGFLRETRAMAVADTAKYPNDLCRTGLEDYLEVIFPDVHDWIHDKQLGEVNGKVIRKRPDYRSETLKMIIEFDGVPHYKDPAKIIDDKKTTKMYEKLGYKVVRIPYFIQLTKSVVKQLFEVEIEQELFDESIPSLGSEYHNTPAFLCIAGVERMASEFRHFPEQYEVNIEALKRDPDFDLTRWDLLEWIYKH